MTFKEKLASGKSLVTSEIGPPKGISLDKVLEEMFPLKGRLDAVNVTDLQSSCLRMSALAGSILLKGNGFEPILQMACRDRNRLALQADALSAAAFGIENILALTGDHPSLGDHPQAKPVFDIDAVQLLEALKGLEGGTDMNGHKLIGAAPRFCLGAVVNPGADPLEPEIIKMEKKINAGAEFFQTQAVYDVRTFENFLKASRHLRVKILAGVMLLKSEKMAHYMNDHVPGVMVPAAIIEQMAAAKDKKAQCVAISARLIKELRSTGVAGIHIMPIGWYGVVPLLLDEIGS
jgi:5,10-methylenetetrahydrofolate reductase